MSQDSPALGTAVVSDGSQQGMREDSTQVTQKQAPGKTQMSESRFAVHKKLHTLLPLKVIFLIP